MSNENQSTREQETGEKADPCAFCGKPANNPITGGMLADEEVVCSAECYDRFLNSGGAPQPSSPSPEAALPSVEIQRETNMEFNERANAAEQALARAQAVLRIAAIWAPHNHESGQDNNGFCPKCNADAALNPQPESKPQEKPKP